MARAVLQYAFVALLALLSAQAAVPSSRVVAPTQIVCSVQVEQQAPQPARRIRPDFPVRLVPLSAFDRRAKCEPETAALFERPPPVSSLRT